ncbi:MAG: uracil-DNA glycosylase family protein [Leptonema sp. (in: bacteria)]
MTDITVLKEKYITLLKNLEEYLNSSKNSEVAIFYTQLKEKIWIPQKKTKKVSLSIPEKENAKIPLTENQACQLCKNKLYAVRNYFKIPKISPKKIMVILYNGSLNEKNIPKDFSHRFYFSSQEEDEIFNKMLSKVNLNLQNLYVMEFVACHFPGNSIYEEWKQRVENCLYFLKKNIIENQIEKLIVVGNAALLLFGEEAPNFAKSSTIFHSSIEEKKIPTLVLRSPLAILYIEKNRKEYEKKLEQFKEEYKYYIQNLKNINQLKEEIRGEVLKQKNIKVIGNTKLFTANQIKSEKEIEKEIKTKLGTAKFILYKSISYRIEEIHIKNQILNSLEKFLE